MPSLQPSIPDATRPADETRGNASSGPHTSTLGTRRRIAAVIRLLRPHQWLKNILVFVPIVAAHQVSDFSALVRSSIAFWAFSLTASALYVINDYLDVSADRAHPRKCRRPLASGEVPTAWAPPIAIALLAGGILLSVLLPQLFAWTLVSYAVASFSYSAFFKSRLLVDVLLLAGLYTCRIFGGGAAAGIAISPWLFAFSFFLFLSLAYVKRYVELQRAVARSVHSLQRRGYVAEDLDLLRVVGPTSGYAAALVLTLYLQSAGVQSLYRSPQLLWLNSALVVYWITRVWFFARRDALDDDPLLFAATDHVSRYCVICAAAIFWLAT